MSDNKLFAFVLMPFSQSFDDIYKIGIKETAESLDVLAERVDEQIFQEGILDRIYRQIDAADIIIADMTGQNPNVFYEVGYAHAKEKLCILLTKNSEDIPFDLKHHRHIVYEDSILGLKESLVKELTWAIKQVENSNSSHINVSLSSSWGELETYSSFHKGQVNISIDLSNNSSKSSSDIESIYFYTGKGWSLIQDKSICPSVTSDLDGFSKRHFIKSPVRKLTKNGGWAQLEFTSSKILAMKSRGDILKSSYDVSGRSILRITTAEGNYDYELFIKAECDEIPF